MMKRPLHEQIKSAFNSEELSQFCFLLGVDDEDLAGSTKAMKALALQQFMQRVGRMNELLVALKQERPHLDLTSYLYLVVLEQFHSETAVIQLLQQFGLPVRDFPEPEKFAWGSEAWREQKVAGVQDWVERNGRLPELLTLLKAESADLRFYQ
jgi:hypothetical protein